ncbi:uncharacterized protein N7483_008107 [Penicillium malachiteum]|uniref:uncharacterized protein n=1 Tax=Penicillium malachiteum TaxID=1324776 RepID=UPI00254755CC|nr:uncharacterized protein N7483_008107 [Penicillium malachiteum]KAJ5726750.1 hypothetical protein N7483_008107 [Penicillium malachiteum]
MAIKTVAVAGGSGSIGKPIIESLVASGFEVTVLVRGDKPSVFAEPVKTTTVDYASHTSLVSALQGIDALISVLSGPGLDYQPALLDAAIEAGVSRFLPSEFGANTYIPLTSQIPIFQGKVAFQKLLSKKVEEHPSLSYSLVVHGPLFDICLAGGLLCDVQNREMTIYDGGNNRFSTTCLSDLGAVVVGILRNPEKTKNRAIFVERANLTQIKLLEILEKVTQSTWIRKEENISDLDTAMRAELTKEQSNPGVFIPGFLKVVIFGGSAYGADLNEQTPGLDNEIVGLKPYTEDDLEMRIRAIVAQA